MQGADFEAADEVRQGSARNLQLQPAAGRESGLLTADRQKHETENFRAQQQSFPTANRRKSGPGWQMGLGPRVLTANRQKAGSKHLLEM